MFLCECFFIFTNRQEAKKIRISHLTGKKLMFKMRLSISKRRINSCFIYSQILFLTSFIHPMFQLKLLFIC